MTPITPNAGAAAKQLGARIVVTPATPRIVARDTLRLTAQVLDSTGKPIAGVRPRFFLAGGQFEAHVDSTGLISSGAASKIPVVVSALSPGLRPSRQSFRSRPVR